jgi:hypothetical protein
LGDAVSGFTPGPWDYDAEDFEIYALETFETLELTEPNARLIAAAPELLEALIEAREMLEWYETALTQEDFNSPKINAAISKATGEAK